MSPAFDTALTLISGISWTIVYIDIILRSYKDKTYGMPLFALAFNIAWEFIDGFLGGNGFDLQKVVNIVWFALDVVIIFAYFKFGRREFPKAHKRFFIPWSVTAFFVGFITLYFTRLEFDGLWGARYSAFAQNLMMSVLFIGMLIRRNNVDGQSIYIAIFKWLGTLAPTILISIETGSILILILGICAFLYDVIYIGLLYHQFIKMGLNPFTRKPTS